MNLVKHQLVVRNACGFDGNGSVNGFPITPNKLFTQEVLNSLRPLLLMFFFIGCLIEFVLIQSFEKFRSFFFFFFVWGVEGSTL